MEDREIIELYFRREEAAVTETARKYGAYCRAIAVNLLSDGRDAEECVNETFFRAWNAIPPERPERLKAWLGAVTRNLAFHLLKANRAQKRDCGAAEALDELLDAVPSLQNTEREVESRELGQTVDRWLRSLPEAERRLFLRRYWYGVPLKDLAAETGISAPKLAKQMYRLRRELKSFLEKEEQLYG